MFETVVEVLRAREQAGLLIGGVFVVLLGGAFFADFVYWRLRARRYRGTIIGLRRGESGQHNNAIYYPVVEYQDDGGAIVRAETDAGSSNLADKLPGRKVTLLAMDDRPGQVRIVGVARLVFALIFLTAGIVLGAIALNSYTINGWSFVVGAILLLILALTAAGKLARAGRTQGAGSGMERFRRQLEQRQALPLLDREAIRPLLDAMNRRTRRLLPLMGLIGLGLVGTGHYLGQDLYVFLARADSASGAIIGHESQYFPADGRYSYYPLVAFTAPSGERVRFRDKMGSSVPAYRQGDGVKVIYNPHDPGQAMIDRGVANWAFPLGLFSVGVLILFATLSGWAGLRRRQSRF